MARTAIRGILKNLNSAGSDVLQLLDACQGSEYTDHWHQDSTLYREFGRKLISADYSARAFELMREGLGVHPNDHDLMYFRALALARGGNVSKTSQFVDHLLRQPGLALRLKVEAICLMGRIQKDRYEQSDNPTRKLRLAAESARLYEKAHKLADNSYAGINAASMALLAGRATKARRTATQVVAQAQAERRQRGRANDYWLLATLGEANVILCRPEKAAQWYRKAVDRAGDCIGDIASMRRSVQFLSSVIDVDSEIKSLLDIGRVIVFAGHMIDHPDRVSLTGLPPRFPADPGLERRVNRAIKKELDSLNALVGFSSAACGSDILFAEQMLKRGGELHIVLPFNKEDFLQTSVDFGKKRFATWAKRFDRVLAGASGIHYATTEPYLGDDFLFQFVNTMTHGLAITRAARLGVEPRALAVLDDSAKRKLGGTRSFVDAWTKAGQKASVINLQSMRSIKVAKSPSRKSNRARGERSSKRRIRRKLKAMLFADIKNFSRLREEQSPLFFTRFLGEIARVIKASSRKPVFQNTWGDGLYAVFDRVTDCADFASRLLERLARVDFEGIGLPADTGVRIGLHAGPVFPGKDPIINRINYFGSHVTRAARIEPVTPPGCAFASEQFAAALTVEPDHDFLCEFVGTESLAKGFDECPLYRLMRRP